MEDKHFAKTDQEWMKKMAPLREKRISGGMLKGFSASVERRLRPEKEAAKTRHAFMPAWVPVAAILVMASLVVLRSPSSSLLPQMQTMELAQAVDGGGIQYEIALLKELGAWNENEEENLLGAEAVAADLELSSLDASFLA